MKKIYITSGVGRSGKDTFCEFISKYIPTYKYSIVDLPKEAAKVLGWDGGKTEKDRKFLSDIMDLSTDYNDAPFKDVYMRLIIASVSSLLKTEEGVSTIS